MCALYSNTSIVVVAIGTKMCQCAQYRSQQSHAVRSRGVKHRSKNRSRKLLQASMYDPCMKVIHVHH